jgi:putative long chain acyl-CoA synthase
MPPAARRRRFQKPLRRLAMATQNALEVIRFGRLTAPYGAAFDVVHEERTHKLRRYQGAPGVAPQGTPLLLVPPLMVASEVYDISPDVSAVAALLAAGVDVWVVDFGAPERTEGGMHRTLDDHVRAVSDAIEHVRRVRGRDLHLAGYSQGGMFAYQAAAFRRGAGLASVIAFGAPVDVHQNIPTLGEAITERLIDGARSALAVPLARAPGLPGFLTSTGFKLLSARKEVAQFVDFVRKLHDRGALERREAKRLFLRGQGFVAWPGPALRKFVDDMIVANRMVAGGFVIDGTPVTLADIRCPILCFVGLRDEIARAPAVRAIHEAAPNAEVFEVGVKAGHFGLVVGQLALSRTWATVIEWLAWRDGAGPRPAALVNDHPVPKLVGDDDTETAFEDLQLDLELLTDLAAKGASALWHRVEDRATELIDSLDRVRYQVPRLEKLRSMTPETRVSIGRSLAERVAASPEGTFFLWRGRAFSYKDAEARVNAVVRGLIACGVRPGQQIGVLMQGRPSYLTLATALSRIGAISVLLPPETPDAALGRALDGLELAALVTDPEHASRARAAFAGPVLSLGGGGAGTSRALPEGVVDMEAIDPAAVKLPAWYLADPGRAADLAMIILTVGRGGEPRLSRVTNQRWAFSAYGAAASCTLTPKDTVYSCLPLHHPAGAMVSAGGALVSGARLALADRFEPTEFWTEVRRYGATVVFYAGEMCRALVDAPHTRGEANHPVRLFAGSGMREGVWNRLQERFNGVGVLEFYASTETNAVLANASGEKIGALGRPIPGSSELAVVAYDAAAGVFTRDADGWCTHAAPGAPGMLLARLDAPGHAPLQRVLRGAFAPGDAWYITGDLLRLDGDGDYWFVERAADLVRTGDGVVAPRELEDALYRAAAVTLCAAYGLTTPAGNEVPVAAVVLRAGATLTEAELSAAVASLPPHARPQLVRVVAQIPMTEGFRPVRAALRAEGWPEGGGAFVYEGGHYRKARSAA